MSNKFAQGIYRVENPNKYVGKGQPRYRSGWEHAFMLFCDRNPSILKWASESIRIPYRNPLTGKNTVYVPDFLVQYQDKHSKVRTELVEIKPKKQSLIESRQSNRDRAAVVLNHAKWTAAQAWCRQQGLTFRVVTEEDIFHQGRRR